MKINDVPRLLKRVFLNDVILTSSSANVISLNPLLVGTYGVGKSSICKSVAEQLGGQCLTIECSAMKEGEITGLPYSQDNGTGKKELQFIPYFLVSQIQELEKAYFEKAINEGFLNGKIKLVAEKTDDKKPVYNLVYNYNNKEYTVKAKDKYSRILNNTLNNYKFGNELPAELKMELLKSGEIKTVVLFFDEINRTTQEVMKEYMNIILTRVVNGYEFPWWVRIIAAENPAGADSEFATNEMDPAQLDRFVQIFVDADLKNWSESYAIDMNLDDKYILALSSLSPEFFIDKSQLNKEDRLTNSSKPSPRSHELCSHIYGDQEFVNNSGFFTPEELDPNVIEKDITTLINGKIGKTAGQAIWARLKNSEDYIKPESVINGSSNKISETAANKIKTTRNFAAKIVLSRGIANLIANDLIKYYYISLYSKNTAEKTKARDKWANIVDQIKDFIKLLDENTVATFAKLCKSVQVNITDNIGVNMDKYNNACNIFRAIAVAFSTEFLSTMHLIDDVIKSGEIDKE